MDKFDIQDESKYSPISEKSYTRRAQIPIRFLRFKQLTESPRKALQHENWIMFHHPDHFLIYDIESKCCVFDATYTQLVKSPDLQAEEDPNVAVLYEMRISQDESKHRIVEDDFGLIMDLVLKQLT